MDVGAEGGRGGAGHVTERALVVVYCGVVVMVKRVVEMVKRMVMVKMMVVVKMVMNE